MHSTRERLSSYWGRIKDFLLSPIEEEIGSLTNKQRQLITALEVIRIEDFVSPHIGADRPASDRLLIARAFIAKAIYGHTTTRQLLDQLKIDIRLRRICGWEKTQDVPEEWTFSRAFAELARQELPTKVHEALIVAFQSDRLIGHISRDSTAIEAREKAARRPKSKKTDKAERKRGHPKKGAPPTPKEEKRLERQRSMTFQKCWLICLSVAT